MSFSSPGHRPCELLSWVRTYLERQKCYGLDNKILFRKTLIDLEVKGQGPMKVITVCDTPPYGHAPTYQISLTYLETKMLCNFTKRDEKSAYINQNDQNIYYVSPSNEGRHIVLV
jgi:hypothetical protein